MSSHLGRRSRATHRRTPSRLRRRVVAWTTALATPLALTVGVVAVHGADAATPPPGPQGVIANLFEWNWPSVGSECTNVLGPGGYAGVQVAPPQNSVKRTALGNGSDTVLHPWWEVYQPVDYTLNSRMGSAAQFRTMVRTCRAAGVKVYVDAVINHMADPNQSDQSYGGATFSAGSYPGYTAIDFHSAVGACPTTDGNIDDYNNLQQVRNCNLSGLPDLRTDYGPVRAEIAGYLNHLLAIGVSGFRVDAAKHIGQPDLAAIYSRLHRTVDGTRPYWALEVFGGGPGVLSPQAFVGSGSLLGLDGGQMLENAFKSYAAPYVGSIATLKDFGPSSGLTPSSHTLTFVSNHDTERGSALSYKDGARNILAHVFILADGYGTPEVYSGFTWGDDTNASPPADADGLVTDTVCGTGTWTCVDRDPAVLGMVGWHDHVGSAPRANWWDDGQNVVAFSRGNRGWVALNNGSAAKTITVRTGMAPGSYCDVITGPTQDGACSGATVTVGAGGVATVSVPATGAVAFTAADRAS